MEGVVKALYESGECKEINVVHWNDQNLPFTFDAKYAKYHNRSELNINDLYNVLVDAEPSILYLSGWMDRGYMRAAWRYKKKYDVQVVAGIDDQWEGSIKQNIGALLFRGGLKKLYDFFWVAGSPQYYYAKKMGYSEDRIIFNMLSADSSWFKPINNFTKRFVFLGRFHPVKNILSLIEAYQGLDSIDQSEYPLVLIGSGPLKDQITAYNNKNIQIIPFLEKEELVGELRQGGVFVMPSLHEQWGVAIHEAAIMGYPLLLSKKCGAKTEFLIEGYNGFSFDGESIDDIRTKMKLIISSPLERIELFSKRSSNLGMRITSEISALSLLSILKK